MTQFRFTRPDAFPPVVKNLIIINALVFLAQKTLGGNTYTDENYFALHDIQSVFFKPHQLLTYMFMHGSLMHLLFNMLALWMFGATLENYWGSKRFIQFYLICGLGAAVLHLAVLYFQLDPHWQTLNQFPDTAEKLAFIENPENPLNAPTIGASGSVFGCLAAFGWLFPNTVLYIYALIPIKAKWFVLIYGAIELGLGLGNSAGDNVAHFAHLGGAITGILIILIWNKTNRKTLY